MRKTLLVLSMSLLLQSSLAFGTQVSCSNEAGTCTVEEIRGMCSCGDGLSEGWEMGWDGDGEPQIPEMSEEELMEMCESDLARSCPVPSEQCEPDALQLCTAILTKMGQFESQCEPPILDIECDVEDKDDEGDWEGDTGWQDEKDSDMDPAEDIDIGDSEDMEKPAAVGEEEVVNSTSKEDSAIDFEEDLPAYTGPGSWEIVQCCDELDYNETYREKLDCVDALEDGDCAGYEACVPDWGIYYCDGEMEGDDDYADNGNKDDEGSDIDVDQDIDTDIDWEIPAEDRPRHDGCPIIDDLPFLGCQAAPQAPTTKASLLTLVLTLADI